MSDNANFHTNTSMIKRSVLQRNFSIICNDIFCNTSLSYEAKGLLCTMLSKPDDWIFHKLWLREQSANVGRDKLNRMLNELKQAGYVGIEQVKGKGKFKRSQWFISDVPQFEHSIEQPLTGNPSTDKPHIEQPCTDKPSTDKPLTENRPLLSTDLTKTEHTKTESNINTCSNALNESEHAEIKKAFIFFWLNMSMTKQNKIRTEKAFNKLITRIYLESDRELYVPMELAKIWCQDTLERKNNQQLGFANMQPSKYFTDERMFDEVPESVGNIY